MADKKISELNALLVATGVDLLPIVDTNNTETKKITIALLMASPGPIGIINPNPGEFTTLSVPSGVTVSNFSSNTALGTSNTALPTQNAVKTYVDTAISGLSPNKILQGDSSVEVIDSTAAPASVTITIDASVQGTFDSDGLTLASGTSVNEFSTDGTLAGDSDDAVPTEKAVKTYVDNQTGTSVHNSLTGLQGGDSTSSEFYHLTEAIYNGLFSGSPLIGLGDVLTTNLIVDYGTGDITGSISGTQEFGIDSNGFSLKAGTSVNDISTNGNLGSSDNTLVTQRAIKTYVDTAISGGDNVRRVYSDTTAEILDVLLVDTTSGNVEIVVDSSSNGRVSVKKITSDSNTITLRNSSGLIDRHGEYIIDTYNQSYSLLVDNGEIFIF